MHFRIGAIKTHGIAPTGANVDGRSVLALE